MATALNTALLPVWAQLNPLLYAVTAYDIGLYAGPQTKNGPYDKNLKTGWTTASKTVTGPDAQNNQDLIVMSYNGGSNTNGDECFWFFTAGIATVLPQFLIDILTVSGSPYTVV